MACRAQGGAHTSSKLRQAAQACASHSKPHTRPQPRARLPDRPSWPPAWHCVGGGAYLAVAAGGAGVEGHVLYHAKQRHAQPLEHLCAPAQPREGRAASRLGGLPMWHCALAAQPTAPGAPQAALEASSPWSAHGLRAVPDSRSSPSPHWLRLLLYIRHRLSAIAALPPLPDSLCAACARARARAPAHVDERQVLWRGHQHGARQRDALHQVDLRVARACERQWQRQRQQQGGEETAGSG
jgi:hypothetical protein